MPVWLILKKDIVDAMERNLVLPPS